MPTKPTYAVVLGAGTPALNANRAGTSIAIVSGGTSYLFDAGAGVERRIFEMWARHRALGAKLGPTFLTHLHFDHTLGLPSLLYYGERPFELFGPPGTRQMISHFQAAFAADVELRTDSLNFSLADRTQRVTEIGPGVVYRDSNVTVTAFTVPHGSVRAAFGYRVETSTGRVMVISGDTGPSQAVVDACNGCDLLLHEVFQDDPTRPSPNARFHTTSEQLGDIAVRSRPKLLVLYHQVYRGGDDTGILRAVAARFRGPVISAKDLEVFIVE